MTRYLFQAQYHGATLTDDIGEEFVTLREAEAHATVVAKELGRNRADDQAITVFVNIKRDEGSIVEAVVMDANSGGRIRKLIQSEVVS